MYRNFIDYLVDGWFNKNYGFDSHDTMDLTQFFIYMGQKNRVYDMYDHRVRMIVSSILLVIAVILIIKSIKITRVGE